MTYKQNLKAILDTHLPVIKNEIKDSIIDSILRLKTQEEWIPVSERMPEDGRNVLLCDIDGDVMFGHHANGFPNTYFLAGSACYDYDYIKNIKAWMPLPESYKEAEDEN